MKRPHLVNFLAITTDQNINIRASLSFKNINFFKNKEPQSLAKDIAEEISQEMAPAKVPIQAFKLLNSWSVRIRVIGIDHQQNEVFNKTFDSDPYGGYSFKIPLNKNFPEIKALQVYETGHRPGVELHLGTYIPQVIKSPKKIIICDYDKTLVETKFSTTKELYRSLLTPMDSYPVIENSVEILKGYIDKEFHPFILSASPHFYEDSIRDWLYQNKIFTAGIFLKDYRQVFSLLELNLTPKDLKLQGLYKVNHLLDILLMTGVPDEIVLMGDNYESDPIIYLTISTLLLGNKAPWNLWNILKKQSAFRMNKKQDAYLLNKIYQMDSLRAQRKASGRPLSDIKIFIRKKGSENSIEVSKDFNELIPMIELYQGKLDKIEGPQSTK